MCMVVWWSSWRFRSSVDLKSLTRQLPNARQMTENIGMILPFHDNFNWIFNASDFHAMLKTRSKVDTTNAHLPTLAVLTLTHMIRESPRLRDPIDSLAHSETYLRRLLLCKESPNSEPPRLLTWKKYLFYSEPDRSVELFFLGSLHFTSLQGAETIGIFFKIK